MARMVGVGALCFLIGVVVGRATASLGAATVPTARDEVAASPVPLDASASVDASGVHDAGSVPDAWTEPDSGVRWEIRDTTDEMRGTVTHIACIDATSELRLGFPYEDASAFLCVRQREGERLEAYFGVTSGQPQCGFDGCRVPVRFDDDEVTELRASGSDTGASLFLSDATGFVRRLVAAHRFMIEVQFFVMGRRQITFDHADGLVWELPREAGRRVALPSCVDLLARGEHGPCR